MRAALYISKNHGISGPPIALMHFSAHPMKVSHEIVSICYVSEHLFCMLIGLELGISTVEPSGSDR